MARIGRFGRRTASGSNLASMVASLIAQQRAAEDQAIFDAYNNGGEFKGKRVTDAILLQYIKNRRDGHSKEDALWDKWNNTYIQTKFTVDESKVLLGWKQGKKSAASVSAFYRNSLKQFPTDSAFGREIAGKAADWAKAATGAARSGAGSRASKALNAKIAELSAPIDTFDQATKVLEVYARRSGIIIGNQTLNDADSGRLLDLIESGIVKMPDDSVLTYSDYIKAGQSAYRARTNVINLKAANNIGVKQLLKDRDKAFKYLGGVRAWNDRDAYSVARQTFEEDMARAGGDPYLAREAMIGYAGRLQNIFDVGAKDANIDQDFLGAINNEYVTLTTGKDSGPTVADAFNGKRGTTYSNSVGSDLAADVTAINSAIADIASGKAYYGQESYGDPLGVIPFTPSQDILGQNGLSSDKATQLMSVDGDIRPVVLAGKAVRRLILTDADDNPLSQATVSAMTPDQIRSGFLNGTLKQADGEVLGYEYQNAQTGKKSWGIYQGGQLVFTQENPFSGALGQLGSEYGVLAAPETAVVQGLKRPGEVGPGVVATPVNFDPSLKLSEQIRIVDLAGAALGLSTETTNALLADLRKEQQTRQTLEKSYNDFRAGERSESGAAFAKQANEQYGPPAPGAGTLALLRGAGNVNLTDAMLSGLKKSSIAPPTSVPYPLVQQPTIKVPNLAVPTAPSMTDQLGIKTIPVLSPNTGLPTGKSYSDYTPTVEEREAENVLPTITKVTAF